MSQVIIGSAFIVVHFVLLVVSMLNTDSLVLKLSMILLGVLWQKIAAEIMDNNRIKCDTLEDFVKKQRDMYKINIPFDVFMLVTSIFVFITIKNIDVIIKCLIVGAYLFWTILILARDILSLNDLKSMENNKYRVVPRVTKVAKLDKHLVNNKYTIWYLKDSEQRKKKSNELFEIGKSYRLEIVDNGYGSYIVDFKEIDTKSDME